MFGNKIPSSSVWHLGRGVLVVENQEEDGVDRRGFKHRFAQRFTKRGGYNDSCSLGPKTTGALAVWE